MKLPEQAELFAPVIMAWNDMDNAAQRVLTAQPFQMTEAADRLNKARLALREAIQKYDRQLVGAQ